MKAEEIQKMTEDFIGDNEVVKVIAQKIILDLEAKRYFFSQPKKKELICAVVIYLAHIKANNPQPIETIRGIVNSDYPRRAINGEIKNVKKALGMKYCKEQTMMGTACIVITEPKSYFIDLCKKENVSQNIEERGNQILEKIKGDATFQSCNPAYVGGTVFYVASMLEGINITQRSVADKINATEVTIRNLLYRILALDKTWEERFKEIDVQKHIKAKETKREQFKKQMERLGTTETEIKVRTLWKEKKMETKTYEEMENFIRRFKKNGRF
jgi:transcription initiation factor TFIIIB Brf1 subunit/transcription initiation factor TFIIB